MQRSFTPYILTLALVSACETSSTDEAGETGDDQTPMLIEAELDSGYPQLDAACRGPIAEPSHLVVTSTDFNTGAVGLVELATRTVFADLALASSDAVPVVADGRVFVVNRLGFDYIDELDPENSLALIHEFSIAPLGAEVPANPQIIALDPQDRGWVSLFGAGELQQIRFPELAAAQPSLGLAVDLSQFADADGSPELGALIGCGSLLFVAAARIDTSNWVPADQTLLIPVLTGDQPKLFDFDPDNPGADAIRLLGDGLTSWRIDPGDPSGHTIVALNSGLERIDLATGQSEWLVAEQVFTDAGYERLQLSSFDFDADGGVWVSVATADFSGSQLLRVDVDGPELVVAVEGLQSVGGALEIVGHEAWFADTTIGASGLRGFDLAADPVVELAESPLAVGLPPLALAPLSL